MRQKRVYSLLIALVLLFSLLVTSALAAETETAAEESVSAANAGEMAVSDGEQEPEEPAEGLTDGWHEEDGRRYYVLNGERMTDSAREIDGVWYGFDSEGYQYFDATFYAHDPNGNYREFCAKSDGTLCRSEWYADRYYDADLNRVADCVYEIDGVLYGFDSDGYLYRDTLFSAYDDDWNWRDYYAKADGSVCRNEWYGDRYFDDSYNLVQDCVRQIDGKWYGFDSEGYLYRDTAFYAHDEDWNWAYYYAGEDGVLACNAWVDSHYYDSSCRMVADRIYQVDGVWYGFDGNGERYTSTSFSMADEYDVWWEYYAGDDGALACNAWVDSRYYDGSCHLITDHVFQLDGVWYGVDGAGCQYVNTTFYAYDADENWKCYRAKEDGTLCVNEWYVSSDSSERWYFGPNAAGVNGPYEIDGTTYLFNDGYLQRGQVWSNGSEAYYADENGVAYALNADGWTFVGEEIYYLENGQTVYGPREHDGSWYFLSNSRALRNTTLYTYDDSLQAEVCYWAREDGTLHTNEWDDDHRYFGPNGRSAYGPLTVDGVEYLFGAHGYPMTSGAVTIDGVSYAVGEDGSVGQLKKNGWTQIGDTWYYTVNGVIVRNQVRQINGKWYGFDDQGCMLADRAAQLRDENESNWWFYRAKANGELYVNQWAKADGVWYYYGENGRAVEGMQTVKGEQYIFSYDGRMRTNEIIRYDNVLYSVDGDGALTELNESGWVKAGSNWYYVDNGDLVTDQVRQIDGKWYGFDGEGRMYANTVFDFYDSDSGRWVYYRARGNGQLYVNAWYDSGADNYERWFYYGAGGKAVQGVFTVNGKQYLFYDDGRLMRNGSWSDGTDRYISDDNGIAVKLNPNGWTQVGQTRYYSENGEQVTHQVRQIDGKWYGFDWGGRLYVDTLFDLYDESDDSWTYYRAKADGSLYVNEWYDEGEDYYERWSYYGEGGKAASGVVTVDGTLRLFASDGRMRRSASYTDETGCYISDDDCRAYKLKANGWTQIGTGWYYTVNNQLVTHTVRQIGGKWYGFDWNGRMYSNTIFTIYDEALGREVYYRAKSDGVLYANEWADGSWYYGADGKAAYGRMTVDGTEYLFRYDGRRLVNAAMALDGVVYAADENGAAVALTGDGWQKVGARSYYLVSGTPLHSEVRSIDGSLYGFSGEYYLYQDTAFELYDDAGDRWIYYRAGADGKLLENTWYERYGDRYYFGEGGAALSGVHTVNGVQYLFRYNGSLARNEYTRSKDGYFVSNSVGEAKQLPANGWTKFGGNWYYSVNGEMMRNTVRQIKGSWYAFQWNGQMVVDSTINIYSEELGREVFYRAKEDGVLYENEWFEDYYYGENGAAVSGLQTVDGTQYLFRRDGWKMTDAGASIDGRYYAADQAGAVTELTGNGWKKVGSRWYYLVSGTPLRNEVRQIKGSWYGFSDQYYMYQDAPFQIHTWSEATGDQWHDYRAGSDGKLLENTWWVSVSSERYYYGKDGVAANGLQTVDGQLGYFSNGLLVVNGWVIQDGKSYVTNAVGEVMQLPANGWTEFGGHRYYTVNNQLLFDTTNQIDGNWYAFNSSGWMVTNGVVSFYDNTVDRWVYFRAKLDGTLYVNKWVESYGEWYYYGDGGRSANGLVTVGGKQYLFTYDGRMQTNYAMEIDGAVYAADASGAVTKLPANGWSHVGDYWYYTDGNALTRGFREIKGSLYYFDSEGRMYADRIFDLYDGEHWNYYRAKSDGRLYVNEWLLDNGVWYYYGEGGMARSGVQTVDGKQYYFYVNGRAADNTMVFDDTYLYEVKDRVLTKVTADGLYRLNNGFDLVYISGGKLLKNAWKQIDGAWYYFMSNGAAADDRIRIKDKYYVFDHNHQLQTGGWIHIYGTDIGYAKDSGELVTGEQKIDGRWYYFGEDGSMRTGLQEYNGKAYFYGRDGVYVKKAATGWNSFEGSWYYLTADGAVRNEIRTINGKTYGFNADGKMVTNQQYRNRIFDNDGVQISSGWVELNGQRYYVDPQSGICLIDTIREIDGKTYRFDYLGRMVSGEYWEDGRMTTYAPDGTGTTVSVPNGWTIFAGDYYYYKDGKHVTGWSGDYYLGDDGRMYRNTIVQEKYYVGNNGKWVKTAGWVRPYADDEATTYYVKSGGKVARDEWVTIDGDKYYFSGFVCVKGAFQLDGTIYSFDSNGKLLATVTDNPKDGWLKIGSDWAYVQNGTLVRWGSRIIDGAEYYFEHGLMQKNTVISYESVSYYGSDGKLTTFTGWQQLDGKWYYFHDGGYANIGWITVDGETYFCRPERVTGCYYYDGHLYQFDENGALQGEITKDSGWMKVNGDWYYFRNGALIGSGIYTINGKDYGFEYGRMVTNGIVHDNNWNYMYYVGSDGVVVKNAGWQTVDGNTYYFGADGKAVAGVQKIDGKVYYFHGYIL